MSRSRCTIRSLAIVLLFASLLAGQSLVAGIAAGAAAQAAVPGSETPPPWVVPPAAPLSRAEIVVGETTLDVELALEGWQQQLGLGYRNGLEPGTGMLFPSEVPGPRTFWMKGMRFCLDIIWINDGVIIGAAESVCPDAVGTPDAQRATYPSPGDVTAVLEVPAGWLKEHGYGVGTTVTVEE